ncbi:MAG TPA: hypothetical protein DCQ30_02015 [Acidimicrobiaceae bacterium]|nr:hypothetical protein [Acidimicrobiaceae bacterium]
MAFPRRLLTEGESVVLELRPHWASFGWSVPAATAAVAALVSVTIAFPKAPVAVGEALLAVAAVAGLWLAARAIRRATTALVVTNARLVQRSGVLARQGVEVQLDRVNEISYRQSIGERLLGTGRLYLEVGGERGFLAFHHVRRPAEVAAVLHEQLGGRRSATVSHPHDIGRGRHHGYTPHDWAGAFDTPPAGVPVIEGRSVAQQLVELEDLYRRGVVSETEFGERRARLVELL